MNYKEFNAAIKNLKKFMEEQDKLNKLLRFITSSDYVYSELGNKFIDDYIDLLRKLNNDEDDWISWFVFENDFGKRKRKAIINNKELTISTTRELYKIMLRDR